MKSWPAIGQRVKSVRESERLSQAELADRSKVNISSVFRVEKGKPVRMGTVAKIAAGLDVTLNDLLRRPDSQPEGVNMVIYRSASAPWFAQEDRRSKLPADHYERYQEPAERGRLGRLGFVSWFMSGPTKIMKNGPGLVALEIHGHGFGAYNSQFYEDAVIYAARGSVIVEVGEEKVTLEQGDWAGFKSAELMSIGPVDSLARNNLPPLILWIGANRLRRKKKRES
ncbi:MAG TPA: helix-turn-helix transcriptional regulator [Fimbriimonadaceae bacterium]